jgi:hypothetical protein
MTQNINQYTISLSDCLEDIAENFIYAEAAAFEWEASYSKRALVNTVKFRPSC